MEIGDDKVEKYMIVYGEIYGSQITKEQARNELTALVCFMNAVRTHINNLPTKHLITESNHEFESNQNH